MSYKIGGGTGGGTISGTIANTQVAFGTALDTIGGSASLTWSGTVLGCLGLVNVTPPTAAAIQINPFGIVAGNTGELRFRELVANGTNYVGFKSPDLLTGNVIWVLPDSDGGSGDVLSTNGSGVLSFITVPGGGTIGGTIATNEIAVGFGANAIGGYSTPTSSQFIFNGTTFILKSHINFVGSGREVYTSAATTTDATTTSVFVDILDDNTMYSYNVEVQARRTDAGPEYGTFWRRFVAYREGGGGATLGATVFVPAADEQLTMAATVAIDVTGNQVRGRITGQVGKTIAWRTTVTRDPLASFT